MLTRTRTEGRGRDEMRWDGMVMRGLLYRYVALCYWTRRRIVLCYLDFVWLWLIFLQRFPVA